MPSEPTQPPLIESTGTAAELGASAEAPQASAAEQRNMLALALYDVVLRIGWIFKTESVIIPAVLDTVADAGWLRGCLPVINRMGQSVPPVFYFDRLRRKAFKRGALVGWTAAMSLVFLALAVLWQWVGASPPSWLALAFLAFYSLFSICHGLNQLAYGTVTGKLIHVSNRGRMLAVATPISSVLAIAFAWWLMGDWLARSDRGFVWIFGFTGVCFIAAALVALLLREPADRFSGPARRGMQSWLSAWRVMHDDARFRRFGIVVLLTSISFILFPHYQALGRRRLGLGQDQMMLWVVVQNAAVGVFGLATGWVVHRRGERLALRISLVGSAITPLLAVAFAYLEPEVGKQFYWLVFIPMGMNPILLKTMLGYTLEIAPPDEHPRYISALSLCQALPFVLSPLVGWAIDGAGFEAVFLAGEVVLLVATGLTFWVYEPRHG